MAGVFVKTRDANPALSIVPVAGAARTLVARASVGIAGRDRFRPRTQLAAADDLPVYAVDVWNSGADGLLDRRRRMGFLRRPPMS